MSERPANDTIAAIATAPGAGGVGIVRLSGPRALAIAEAIGGRALLARRATRALFSDAAGFVTGAEIAVDGGFAAMTI